jgi:signal transduction histidine kinase/DNA-binding response OmpR family regulator/ligand-binding sensor domain-containing protein
VFVVLNIEIIMFMNLKYRLLVAVLIVFISISNASEVKFYNINSLFGISMREANSVCKDNNGFIWVSSKTGILRLTEDDYRIYQLPYETANVINVKLVYQKTLLLAYSNNGQIFRYNAISDRFELVLCLRNELNNFFLSVTGILINDANNYFIASTIGLYEYKDGQLALIGTESSIINHFTWYNNHQIIGFKGNQLFIFDTKTKQFSTIFISIIIPTFEVSKLFMDKDHDRLWVGTLSSGLYFYDFKTATFNDPGIKSFPKQPILAIESASETSLLIGIDGQGVWEINKNGDRVLNIYKENSDNISSLRGNGVYDIFCDQNKRVWICTYSGGVSYFEQSSPLVNQITHQVNNSNSLVNNDVNSIIEDSRGNLWFATDNGISCWEVTSNQWKSFYVNKQEQAQVFLTLCEDDRGRIWAGTYSSGVYVLDERTGKELAHYSHQVKGSPFANDYVFDIYKDSRGDLWIGGINSEVIRYRVKENRFQKYSNQALYTFAELSPDQMLFGCTYGLTLSDNQTGVVRILKEGFLTHDILVMNDIVWVATSGDGLIQFNLKNEEIEKYTTQIGLPSNFISSIAYSDGYLWLGTENGLCRFDPNNKNVVVYSSIQSLSHISFNRHAQFKLRNGQLAWGTNNGAVIFNPKAIQQFQSKGKIFFQDLSVSGRSVRDNSSLKLDAPLDNLKDLKLKYNQNTVTLELLPIGVAASSKFSWKMEGLDKDWSQPSSHRILTYTNIPSKDLILRIKLYDNSLSRIIDERTLAIKITPPFWGTWWFLIIAFLIVSTIIYFALLYYINLLKQHHTEEKVRFFTNTAHDIRTSLTLIKAPVEELTKEKNLSVPGHHYLNLAIEQARRLSSVVTQLMDFQKVDIGKGQLSFAMCDLVRFVRDRIQMFESFAKSKDIKLSFKANQLEYITAIDETMMEKVIDNLISNAIKYSHQDSVIHIVLNCTESKWTLEVTDHGIGISKKAQQQLFKEFYRGENAINSKIVGSGIGLLLVKKYVAFHGGQISYTSQENVGTTFQVVIPYKRVNEEGNDKNRLNELSPSAFVFNHLKAQNSTDEIIAKEMRILLVEDNDDLLQFMKYALIEEFEVLIANNGALAWEIVQKQLPDLIVSDVMMPNMDGFELCQLIKSSYETSHIPIILLTALTGKAEQLHGLGLGADDYLTKPFDMGLLKQKIISIIQNREAVREKALKMIKGNNNDPILTNELNDSFLKKMLQVVQKNISNSEFGKEEFASAMNVSTSLLYKKIKVLTDQSPTDFIKVVRLDYALTLLQSRKHTVTEVSELCGFASVGYFSTVFKKYFGKSPTEIIE